MRVGRPSSATITNHILSTVVLIIYLIEFMVVGIATHSASSSYHMHFKAASRDMSLG